MPRYKIAIVGLGPKGLYALERLTATIKAAENLPEIEIHLFEKSGNFGAGMIYDPLQPDYLLMNYPNRNINAWPDKGIRPVIDDTPSFVEWLSRKENPSGPELGDTFSPRSMVGTYLIDCYIKICQTKDSGYSIIEHPTNVLDIQRNHRYLTISEKVDGQRTLIQNEVNEVILTTGHCSWKGRLERLASPVRKRRISEASIPLVYPLPTTFGNIAKDAEVAIKGLGLTFIDSVLALTEGRGGKFIDTGNDTLIYAPSGKEPKRIYGFSRTGLPMIPRNAGEGKSAYEPKYFTHRNIFAQLAIGEKPDFGLHLFPLFEWEAKYRYYERLFDRKGITLYPDKKVYELKRQIMIFHKRYSDVPFFDFSHFFRHVSFDRPDIGLGPEGYLRYLIREATKGSETSPFMAAAMTWGKVSEIFDRVYNFGGMTPESHRIFDTEYRSPINRISYGPPVWNMRKILALVETGILNLDFAQSPSIETVDETIRLRVPNREAVTVTTIIDARIPTNATTQNWSTLLVNLRNSGAIREFSVPGNPKYPTGCPEIDRCGRAVDLQGKVDQNIAFYGTPTEGVTYDNDSLSRTRNDFASGWALRAVERAKCLINT